jgi:tetratricopeptide (TPR) repeat protein
MRLSHVILVPLLTASLGLTACNKQRPLHILLDDARIAAEANQNEAAIADYQELIVRRPDDPEYRYEYAQVCLAQGDAKEAVRQLIICTDVQPLNDKYLDSLAAALYASNDREALTTTLARIAQERARVVDYTRFGDYSARIGNVDEAEQAYITAAKLDQGRTVGPQLVLARFYASVGQSPKEIDRLRMAYFIEPGNPELIQRANELKQILGPTFGMVPVEAVR